MAPVPPLQTTNERWAALSAAQKRFVCEQLVDYTNSQGDIHGVFDVAVGMAYKMQQSLPQTESLNPDTPVPEALETPTKLLEANAEEHENKPEKLIRSVNNNEIELLPSDSLVIATEASQNSEVVDSQQDILTMTDVERAEVAQELVQAKARIKELEAEVEDLKGKAETIELNMKNRLQQRSESMKKTLNKKLVEGKAKYQADLLEEKEKLKRDYELRLQKERKIREASTSANPYATPPFGASALGSSSGSLSPAAASGLFGSSKGSVATATGTGMSGIDTSTFSGASGSSATVACTGNQPLSGRSVFHQEREPNGDLYYYGNICFLDSQKQFSPEELRLKDYNRGRRFSVMGPPLSAPAGASGFPPAITTAAPVTQSPRFGESSAPDRSSPADSAETRSGSAAAESLKRKSDDAEQQDKTVKKVQMSNAPSIGEKAALPFEKPAIDPKTGPLNFSASSSPLLGQAHSSTQASSSAAQTKRSSFSGSYGGGATNSVLSGSGSVGIFRSGNGSSSVLSTSSITNPPSSENRSDGGSEDSSRQQTAAHMSRRIPRQRWERCRRCDTIFDATKNDDRRCRKHPDGAFLKPYGYEGYRRWSCCEMGERNVGCQRFVHSAR